MASFSNEFKKYRKQERILTATIVLVAVVAPVSFTWLMQHQVHWAVSMLCAIFVIVTAGWIHLCRDQVAKKILSTYESIDVGAVLDKKIISKPTGQFVVTNRGYNHFYLRCNHTGEQVLVSKNKVREDFNITN